MIKKLVQTFWIDDEKNLGNGWLSSKFHLFSWGLSSWSFSNHFSNTELITNDLGKEILIEKLKLPYKQVSLAQENFSKDFPNIWLLRKIYSYSLQNEPFIHADGDFYLFKKFDEKFLISDLIGQNFEYDHPNYIKAFEAVKNTFLFLPDYIKKDPDGKLSAVNTGIIGGTKFDFFKKYFSEVFNILLLNQSLLNSLKIDDLIFNIFLEQFIFKKLADDLQIEINYLIPEKIGYPYTTYGTDRFWELPNQSHFCHLMSYKLNPTTCEQMAQRLYLENPDLYHHIKNEDTKLNLKSYFIGQYPDFVNQNPPKIFYRSFAIAEAVGLQLSDKEKDDDFIAETLKQIKLLPENHLMEIFKDVWNYELEKYFFLKQLPDTEIYKSYREKQLQLTNLYLKASPENFIKEHVSFGKYFYLIKSKWKWVENNEFTKNFQNGKYYFDHLSNLSKPASHYLVLHFLHAEELLIKEQPVKPLTKLILNVLSQQDQSIAMETLIINVLQEIQNLIPKIDVLKHEIEITSHLRYLLYQGILCFIDKGK